MKSAREEMDIVNAYQTLGTYRGAAALCGTTHKTVKRVVERRAQGQVGRQCQRPLKASAVAGLIGERVRLTDGRISAKRLLPVAQAAGYPGSLRTLQLSTRTPEQQEAARELAALTTGYYAGATESNH